MKKLLNCLAVMCLLPLLLAFSKPGEEYVGVWVHESRPDVKMEISLDETPLLIKLHDEKSTSNAVKVAYDKGQVSFKTKHAEDMSFVLDLVNAEKLLLTIKVQNKEQSFYFIKQPAK